ncbi:MAG: hypothetical protein GOVbin1630_33 [Prokaryotic dsDNA virus sp.]|nr:MAG: hypothetical protein GOVbin1630_33 [Prokaryotic dsDNA virus sp.]|tara:strand:+ start:670 stop:957 length:288 start_codon:yes stop_codon:yes gene_type:complete
MNELSELDALKRNEYAHNELRPKTYVLYSTPCLFGKRTFLEIVSEGVGTARLRAYEWTQKHGEPDRRDGGGKKAEFCLIEDWCEKTHGRLSSRKG